MKREEVVTLLSACKPLADKLAKQGFSARMTFEEYAALGGFTRVVAAGWLKDSHILQEAGLSPEDITPLRFLTGK